MQSNMDSDYELRKVRTVSTVILIKTPFSFNANLFPYYGCSTFKCA